MSRRTWLTITLTCALLTSGCTSQGLYGETEYHWRKPNLSTHQAFHDISICVDQADASGYGTVHQMALVGAFSQGARQIYDDCMLGRGYSSWQLSAAQQERLAGVRSNSERAEILAQFAASPPAEGTGQYSRGD